MTTNRGPDPFRRPESEKADEKPVPAPPHLPLCKEDKANILPGNFSNPALLCSVMAMGVDRIMFSIDHPFVDNKQGTKWIPHVQLCEEDKAKILHGNVERLLKLQAVRWW